MKKLLLIGLSAVSLSATPVLNVTYNQSGWSYHATFELTSPTPIFGVDFYVEGQHISGFNKVDTDFVTNINLILPEDLPGIFSVGNHYVDVTWDRGAFSLPGVIVNARYVIVQPTVPYPPFEQGQGGSVPDGGNTLALLGIGSSLLGVIRKLSA